MPVHRTLACLLTAPALLAAAGCTTPDAAAAPTDTAVTAAAEAGVLVEGVGTAGAVPDVLRVTLAAEATAPTVEEAVSQADDATSRILESLEAQGVTEADVQTVDLQLHPDFGPEGAEPDGYVARQTLAVTLRELDEAGATIGAAVEAGGDAARLQGASYALEEDADVRAEAREAAFADARRTAEQYAQLAGGQLGRVLSVEEQTAVAGPGPVAWAESEAGGAESVPLAPGTSEVTVRTQVRWALE